MRLNGVSHSRTHEAGVDSPHAGHATATDAVCGTILQFNPGALNSKDEAEAETDCEEQNYSGTCFRIIITSILVK